MDFRSESATGRLRLLALAAAVAAVALFAGCSAFWGEPEPAITPASTPKPKPTPEPTPEPKVVIPQGETVTGSVSALLGEQDGVHLFSFETGELSIPVIAHSNVFHDALGDRKTSVELGDRLAISFDAPVLDGEFTQGTAVRVDVMLYGGYEDYKDPAVAALSWIYNASSEMNEDASAAVFNLETAGGAGFSERFMLAMESFCRGNGYSLIDDPTFSQSVSGVDASKRLVFSLSAEQDGDEYTYIVSKSRQGMGEVGARLLVDGEGGEWAVAFVDKEYSNIASPDIGADTGTEVGGTGDETAQP